MVVVVAVVVMIVSGGGGGGGGDGGGDGGGGDGGGGGSSSSGSSSSSSNSSSGSSNFISRRIQQNTFHMQDILTIISQIYSSVGCQRSSEAHQADNSCFNNNDSIILHKLPFIELVGPIRLIVKTW